MYLQHKKKQIIFETILFRINPELSTNSPPFSASYGKSTFLFQFFHSSMPSSLAPGPIRVQSCVCCLFWTNRNSMAVTSIFLSISLSIRVMNPSIGDVSKWKYLLLLKLKWYMRRFIIHPTVRPTYSYI